MVAMKIILILFTKAKNPHPLYRAHFSWCFSDIFLTNAPIFSILDATERARSAPRSTYKTYWFWFEQMRLEGKREKRHFLDISPTIFLILSILAAMNRARFPDRSTYKTCWGSNKYKPLNTRNMKTVGKNWKNREFQTAEIFLGPEYLDSRKTVWSLALIGWKSTNQWNRSGSTEFLIGRDFRWLCDWLKIESKSQKWNSLRNGIPQKSKEWFNPSPIVQSPATLLDVFRISLQRMLRSLQFLMHRKELVLLHVPHIKHIDFVLNKCG